MYLHRRIQVDVPPGFTAERQDAQTTCAILMNERIPIVIDTREQTAYAFDPNRFQVVRRRPFPQATTRWSAAEERVAVERKSLADFVQTVIRSRRRFHEELRKLTTHEFACVVVEGSLRDMLEGRTPRQAHTPMPFSARPCRYASTGAMPVYFCGDRQTAKQFVEAYLERCARASCATLGEANVAIA